ncbi:hypothetical protein A9W99_01860 [Mycobacterium sp. 1164966.3]|uniref:hypothetical protein n=1 Tax=Mycobacterium sp. 1164966.3 TaxID=1856861 RepID=UPI000801BF3F|nr:hypothetical protein [Mycobacterium sp. 1164966.3]OBA82465.1 hypothetical protein A9W99_01860 [Mycobacterium sp. 1164966.3]
MVLLRRLAPLGISIIALLAIGVSLSTRSGPEATSSKYHLISTATPPASPGIPLPPNEQGYVRVQTKSGSTSCSINAEVVACRTNANNWPTMPDGQHYHVASINADGEFHWVNADLGLLEGKVTMDYQTYSAQGWTIVASPDGTKFTNDRTGHGMSVDTQNVTPF